MKIFVTGGTGFIGRPVVSRLLESGHEVMVLSRSRRETIAVLSDGATVLRGGMADTKAWEAELAAWGPDAALHLAWEGIPDYGLDMSLKNLSQGVALFQMLARIGCKKIVATGSCWEYGRTAGELSEDMPPMPAGPFAIAKVALNAFGGDIAKSAGIEFVWARIFYAYGPGQKPASLIPHLIGEYRRGVAPNVKNPNGGNDFVYVADVAEALQLLIEKKTSYDLYNIGSRTVTGVSEIVKLIYGEDLVKRNGHVQAFFADISRIAGDIGWKPSTDIEAGIAAMVEEN